MMKLGFTAQEAAAMSDIEVTGYLEAQEEIVKGKPKKAYVIKTKQAAKAKAAKPKSRR